MLLAARRLEDERDAKLAGNRAYEEYRATGRDTQGRRLSKQPHAWTAPDVPEGVVSVSDPDNQRMKANLGYVQGYNAQAVVDEGQIVIAAEITNDPADFSQLDPMITTAVGELERAGVTERPQVALADAQYWNEQHFDEVIANKHIQVLIPPDSGGATSPRRGWIGGRYSWMRAVLDSPHGKELYRKRIQMIEPVFAHPKHNRLINRFHRKGRVAVRTEWRLLMATHTSPSSTATNSPPPAPEPEPAHGSHRQRRRVTQTASRDRGVARQRPGRPLAPPPMIDENPWCRRAEAGEAWCGS